MFTMQLRLFAVMVVMCVSCRTVADELSQEAVCAQVYCRALATITLRLDKDTAMDFDVGGIPVAFERDVNLFPGEAVELTVTIENGEIKSLNYDPDSFDSRKVISVRFSQNDEEPYGMMLVVKNPFERYLRYEAFLAVPNRDGFAYTSSCPVGPGMSTFESWPHPISHIVLTNIHLVDSTQDGDSIEITCK